MSFTGPCLTFSAGPCSTSSRDVFPDVSAKTSAAKLGKRLVKSAPRAPSTRAEIGVATMDADANAFSSGEAFAAMMAASAANPRLGSSAPRPKLAAKSAAPPDAIPAPRHAPHATARVATPPRRRRRASDSSSAFAAAYGSCPTDPTSAATEAKSATPRDGHSSPRDSAARFSAASFGAATTRASPAVCRKIVPSRSAPAAWNVAATFRPTRSRA